MKKVQVSMECPKCAGSAMRPRLTRTGVELDQCKRCDSVWLDRGEIFLHLQPKFHDELDDSLVKARQRNVVSRYASPRSGQRMLEADFTGNGRSDAYLDPATSGCWLPADSLQTFIDDYHFDLAWAEEGRGATRYVRRLPNLALRSTMTLGGLYALLVAGLIALSLVMPAFTAEVILIIGVVIVLLGFLISPFLMDLSLRWLYKSSWVPISQLPDSLARFVTVTCEKHRMKLPSFGIIADQAPNAFTYGHTPNNARIVITEGLFELLEPAELNAVVGHEIGHAHNWDMLLMTLAQLVPLVFYFIYRTMIDAAARMRPSGKNDPRGVMIAIAIGAFIVYIISQYVVLWFSRLREYYADQFGARAVGSPAALAGALVKIAYGLARNQAGTKAAAKADGDAAPAKKETTSLSAIGAMGICNVASGQSLAVTSGIRSADAAAGNYAVDKASIRGAMKWDLWNPWAGWFELNSTHPLTAKRLLHLTKQSQEQGEEPYITFDLVKPESYWDEFLFDVLVTFLPYILLVGSIGYTLAGGPLMNIGGAVVLFGLASLWKLRFRYPRAAFPEMSVETLLHQVEVSNIRPVPCTLEGKVRGKGVPGLIWSDDFVMQDDTGIIFIDHRQPLAIWEWIWGWLRGDSLIGGHVRVKGWYRRSPMPFIEIKEFTVDGKRRRSYLWMFRYFTTFVIIGIGLLLLGSGI